MNEFSKAQAWFGAGRKLPMGAVAAVLAVSALSGCASSGDETHAAWSRPAGRTSFLTLAMDTADNDPAPRVRARPIDTRVSRTRTTESPAEAADRAKFARIKADLARQQAELKNFEMQHPYRGERWSARDEERLVEANAAAERAQIENQACVTHNVCH